MEPSTPRTISRPSEEPIARTVLVTAASTTVCRPRGRLPPPSTPPSASPIPPSSPHASFGSPATAWFEALERACARIARHGADALVVSLGLDTFAGDPISAFALQSDDFSRLGQRLARLGLPTAFVLEGGYAAAELGVNAVNVIEGFEQG